MCEANGGRVCRELYPHVNFLSQDPAVVHFGLGEAAKVDRLTIRWPSGRTQEFRDLAVNQYLLIQESDPVPKPIVPGKDRLSAVAGK